MMSYLDERTPYPGSIFFFFLAKLLIPVPLNRFDDLDIQRSILEQRMM